MISSAMPLVATPAVLPTVGEVVARCEALQSENAALLMSLRESRDTIGRFQQELIRERRELAAYVDEYERQAAELAMVTEERSNLATLYVASCSLHDSRDPDRVLQGVQEILINLVGTEDFAVFALDRACGMLRRVHSFGRTVADIQPLAQAASPLTCCLEEGRTIVAEAAQTETAAACVPLLIDGQAVGAVEIFSLLPQKLGLGPLDADLMELLSRQAGAALLGAGLLPGTVAGSSESV